MPNKSRTALFLRCADEESNLIREAARQERYTVSKYVVNVTMSYIRNRGLTVQKTEASSWRPIGDGTD